MIYVSVLRYPGGKFKALKYILPIINKCNFTEFREPFVGGGSVFLNTKAKINPLATYKINDIDENLIIFWFELQNNSEELIKELIKIKKNTKDGRKLYTDLKNEISKDKFKIALKYYIMNRITFSGLVNSGGYSPESFEKRFTTSSIERLIKYATLLQNVKITQGDYNNLLKESGENVLIFLDPPYNTVKKGKLYGSYTEFDINKFLKNLEKCNHSWILTYDHFKSDISDVKINSNFEKTLWFSYSMDSINKSKITKMGYEIILAYFKELKKNV